MVRSMLSDWFYGTAELRTYVINVDTLLDFAKRYKDLRPKAKLTGEIVDLYLGPREIDEGDPPTPRG